ncbi:MAG TPA: hypothetical protein VG520_09655 [Candidatus Dormibacteraeota bacterium]|jgi:hypothetical protein|nr:hypothetical protein [Candidatus Dormibacteraeota bacterium]
MTLRGRLIALAATAVLLLGGTIVVLLRSRTADCTVVAPRPSLAPVLRALGDFDQSYDAGNVAALEDAAGRAAAALHPDLIGATAETPVAVAAARPGAPAALVVPLRSHTPLSNGAPPLAGLVAFLRDCQGNAYFAAVEDDALLQPPLLQFPSITRDQAARLGLSSVHLEYLDSPFSPRWQTTGQPAQSLAAR